MIFRGQGWTVDTESPCVQYTLLKGGLKKKNKPHWHDVPSERQQCRVHMRPGKPGKRLTTFPVMKNTWKIRKEKSQKSRKS